MSIKTLPYLKGLIDELCKLPKECEWVEFKQDYADEHDIGTYISALSNSAALHGKDHAYLAWGIDNSTHDIIGTNFDPSKMRIGNEELENWLLQRLDPKIHFGFNKINIDGKHVIVLDIPRANKHPVTFEREGYIRVGSYRKKLKNLPEKERELWRVLDDLSFELLPAKERVSAEDVLKLLDYPAFFRLLELPIPNGHAAILNALLCDDIVFECDAGGYNITNLGAILLAQDLNDFPTLRRKAIRVIQYEGSGRLETVKEQGNTKGYATDFDNIIKHIMALVPAKETIRTALRQSVSMFPQIAVRELVANALIHQDFIEKGCGPMVELFDKRIEITNPGEPLISTDRFMDSPPKSRNEKLASLMRRFGICEERGSGIDKVVTQIETLQLPAPRFERPDGFTKVTLFAHKDFEDMDRTERVRACYYHCCLQYLNNKKMTNTSLRNRFGLPKEKAPAITRVINAAIEENLINTTIYESKRNVAYVPFWSTSKEKNTAG